MQMEHSTGADHQQGRVATGTGDSSVGRGLLRLYRSTVHTLESNWLAPTSIVSLLTVPQVRYVDP